MDNQGMVLNSKARLFTRPQWRAEAYCRRAMLRFSYSAMLVLWLQLQLSITHCHTRTSCALLAACGSA